MRFPNDVVALFDCGTSLGNRDELEAIGTEGSLFLDDPWHCNVPVIELRQGDTVELIEVEGANPYRLELEDLNAAIRGERAPLLGRADALGQVRAIDALFRSADSGAVVTLYPREPLRGLRRMVNGSHRTEEETMRRVLLALSAVGAVAALLSGCGGGSGGGGYGAGHNGRHHDGGSRGSRRREDALRLGRARIRHLDGETTALPVPTR